MIHEKGKVGPHPHGPMVVVCEKAMGARLSDLRDQICGHIPSQAGQWAPNGPCYRPLFDGCVLCWGLVAMVPQPPSHPTARTLQRQVAQPLPRGNSYILAVALSSEGISLVLTVDNCMIKKPWW